MPVRSPPGPPVHETPELIGIAVDAHAVVFRALQVHLDAAQAFIVDRLVCEITGIEVRIEAPVDMRKHVQVEICRDAPCIVVGSFQDSDIFLQIHANQQACPTSCLTRRSNWTAEAGSKLPMLEPGKKAL